MRRRHRIALVFAALIAASGAVFTLTAFSSAAEGPLSYALSRIGTFVAALEKRMSERVRPSSRQSALGWFAAHRTDAQRLANPDTILVGAYDSGLPHTLEGVIELERLLATNLPLVHFYAAWGDRPEQQFPLRELSAIHEIGSVPVVTWEPWLTDFENTLHAHLPLRDARDRGGLAAIDSGTYDFYIDRWAQAAASFAKPMLVRLGHEMNDPYRYPWGPQNNRAEDFVAAWRHVVERFRRAGATNVLWVWSPHVAYPYVEYYYPGDDYVDWVATGALNYGTVAHWSDWYSFEQIFGEKYPQLASFGKPVMIAEFGSLAVGGDRAGWYRDALSDLPERHPAVRALVFFNVPSDQTVTLQQLDWSVNGDSATIRAIREAIAPWAPGVGPASGGP